MSDIENKAYVICWEPASDFGDHDLSELVYAVSSSSVGALGAAKRLAHKMAKTSDEYLSWKDPASEPTPVIGLDEMIASLASKPAAEVRLRVGEGQSRYGSVVVMAVNHE